MFLDNCFIKLFFRKDVIHVQADILLCGLKKFKSFPPKSSEVESLYLQDEQTRKNKATIRNFRIVQKSWVRCRSLNREFQLLGIS
jgi:hypothetical protein